VTIEKHGLSIGIERQGAEYFLQLKAVGKLTHEDYQTITPMIDAALDGVAAPCVNAYFDATELEGWEMRAAWDDFKIGLKHGKQFNKIALLGNKKWQELAAKCGAWFISGEVKYFQQEEASEAMAWLNE
jgi:hypothetical protein